jgi:hypothetical protein
VIANEAADAAYNGDKEFCYTPTTENWKQAGRRLTAAKEDDLLSRMTYANVTSRYIEGH